MFSYSAFWRQIYAESLLHFKAIINRCAGLAWMRPSTCHLPKTQNIKTSHFNSNREEEATKRLFRLLVELQTELTNYLQTSTNYQQEFHSELTDLKFAMYV